ncbi:MAG TPA: flagellar hook assembly protein FlgD [Accumulibacter sp.]|jgi:flagellar basal-body rod modification protein FlgD|nr:flagellar hook assembly protein FlgD [Accumulibacter sp.]
MATSSVNSASDIFAALNGKRTGSDASATAGTQDRFLKLLVTQLQNQDPLNPLDNAAVTSQLSQISTVTGIEKMNETLTSLLSSYSDNQSIQAAGLIGKNVLAPGTALKLAGGQATGGVNLAAAADQVRVSILDSSGAVLQVQNLGARPAGSFAFVWDGKTDQGATAPAGNYHFSVNAVQAGEKVTADPLQLGTVSALIRGKSGFELELGALGRVDFTKVQQIF